jgi:putative zinc finger protein
MNCKSFEGWIALYVEGDLDPARARNVESHLESCVSCRHFLNVLEASQAIVKELAAESLDPSSFDVVRQRVMQEVNRRQSTRSAWWRFLSPGIVQWRPAWVASVAVLVGLGFLLQWQLWRKPTSSAGHDSTPALSPAVRNEGTGTSLPNLPEKMTPNLEPLPELAMRQVSKHHRSPLPQRLLVPAGGQPDAIAAESEPPLEQGSNLEPEQPPPPEVPAEPPPPLVIKLVTDDPNIVIVWLVDQEVHND